MKRKVGTVIEKDVFTETKLRAAREGRKLADVVQDALIRYLHENVSHGDALRAVEKFCSHGGTLDLREINVLLQEDILAS